MPNDIMVFDIAILEQSRPVRNGNVTLSKNLLKGLKLLESFLALVITMKR